MNSFQKILVYLQALNCLSASGAFKVVGNTLQAVLFRRIGDDSEIMQMEVFKWVISRSGKVRKDVGGYLVKFADPETKVKVELFIRSSGSDFQVFRQIFIDGEYNEALGLIDSGMDSPKIIDAGSNVGFATVWFKQKIPGAVILAVEADKENYDCLCRNISMNQHLPGIRAFYRALWVDEEDLYIQHNFRDGESHSRVVTLEKHVGTPVRGITPFTLKNYFGSEKVSLFKIDIEGAERKFVDESRIEDLVNGVSSVAIELHPEFVNEADVVAQICALGFQVVRRSETYFFSRRAN